MFKAWNVSLIDMTHWNGQMSNPLVNGKPSLNGSVGISYFFLRN